MYFYNEKLERRISEIASTIYSAEMQITSTMVKEGNNPAYAVSPIDGTWKSVDPSLPWGGNASYQWFRTTLCIPSSWQGEEVALVVETPDDIAWKGSAEYSTYLDGKFVGGLDIFHHELFLGTVPKDGATHELALMAFSGYNTRKPTTRIRLVVINTVAQTYYYDLKNAFEVTEYISDNDTPENLAIEEIVNRSINMVDFRIPKSPAYYASLKPADDLLKKEIYTKRHSRSDITVSAIGHSHLDVAWLWRLQQTKEKAARVFGTIDRLMDKYPNFKFIQSQPQLYDFIKKEQPELYKRIKKRVAEGRIIPEGGMWVESDCNLVSGESLIRQLLVGKRFFHDEFGVDNRILWLPDVFGYSAALPQILKGCGIDYFMTIKISWNQFNKMPMDTFWLQGIDGTKILTHFMTTPTAKGEGHSRALPYQKTYNGQLCAESIAHGWDTYKQKDANHDLLMAFGYGDGGGGPNEEMLENWKRLKDFPGIPKVKWESPLDFFQRLAKNVLKHPVPTWVGELYLEFHRGTYTSMARNKMHNRQSEFLYQDAEALSSMAEVLVQAPYPKEILQNGWKLILLNQFHDIIPGSSIREAYDDSLQQYFQLENDGMRMKTAAIRALAGAIKSENEGIIVFNQNSVATDGIVSARLPESIKSLDDGNVAIQRKPDGTSVFHAVNIPQYGYAVLPFSVKAPKTRNSIKVTRNKMENRFFRIRFDGKGQIIELFDKRQQREVMQEGETGNVLLSFEDKPMNYNAWDIDIYYPEKCWPVDDVQEITVKEEGPVEGILHIKRNYLQSIIEQDIVIYDEIPRIDFRTTIDWKQQEILLKASFPVNVNSTRATYEVQFGTIERNTHSNTSWDVAKFETCAHKWVDLSQNDWGVSLLNDCKYGHDIHGKNIRLSLLKSGIYPNPDADKEVHHFTYSLYPHMGSWVDANTTGQAFALNNPMVAVQIGKQEGTLSSRCSFLSVDNPHIVVETLKKAEEEDAYIVRMYECANTEATGTLRFCCPPKQVVSCNMIEQGNTQVSLQKDSVTLKLRPYEIKTLKVMF